MKIEDRIIEEKFFTMIEKLGIDDEIFLSVAMKRLDEMLREGI